MEVQVEQPVQPEDEHAITLVPRETIYVVRMQDIYFCRSPLSAKNIRTRLQDMHIKTL